MDNCQAPRIDWHKFAKDTVKDFIRGSTLSISESDKANVPSLLFFDEHANSEGFYICTLDRLLKTVNEEWDEGHTRRVIEVLRKHADRLERSL